MRTLTLCTLVFAHALACWSESTTVLSTPSSARFVEVGAGVVQDERTGLVWTARDSNRELSWQSAQRRCQEIDIRTDGPIWRLPTIEELKTLFDALQEQPCGEQTCRTDPAIDLTSPYQWSETARGERRRVYFDFAHGSELSPQLRANLTRRALCTRGS